jgi:hypothetical protein
MPNNKHESVPDSVQGSLFDVASEPQGHGDPDKVTYDLHPEGSYPDPETLEFPTITEDNRPAAGSREFFLLNSLSYLAEASKLKGLIKLNKSPAGRLKALRTMTGNPEATMQGAIEKVPKLMKNARLNHLASYRLEQGKQVDEHDAFALDAWKEFAQAYGTADTTEETERKAANRNKYAHELIIGAQTDDN